MFLFCFCLFFFVWFGLTSRRMQRRSTLQRSCLHKTSLLFSSTILTLQWLASNILSSPSHPHSHSYSHSPVPYSVCKFLNNTVLVGKKNKCRPAPRFGHKPLNYDLAYFSSCCISLFQSSEWHLCLDLLDAAIDGCSPISTIPPPPPTLFTPDWIGKSLCMRSK